MYGHPDIEKTDYQKKADERFIKTVTGSTGSREKAGKEFAGRGWYYLQQGDYATSMRRFNQSWLLAPDYYVPYWGFGVLLNRQNKGAEAIQYFDKALSLIDDSDSDKPRLLADAATTYVAQGHDISTTNNVKSEKFFEKANTLANEVFRLDPQFGNEALKLSTLFNSAYRYGDGLMRGDPRAARIAHSRGNYATALREYRLLAEQDVPAAQVSLAEMYRSGQGVQQDYKEAVKWYRKAAEQGDAGAQKNLGYLYGNGLGVPKDLIKSYMWYYIASVSGHKGALGKRDFTRKKMTPAQIAEAQKLAQDWMDTHR
jgi:TPR repeat protein